MRNFNDYEKNILSEIVKRQEEGLETPLVYFFTLIAEETDLMLEIDLKEKRICGILKIESSPPQNHPNFDSFLIESLKPAKLLYKKYSVVISLMDYLEKNHLIYFFKIQAEVAKDLIKLNKKEGIEEGNLTSPFNLEDIRKEYVFENLLKSIYATPELVLFVQNGFKDTEQIRHDQSLEEQRKSLDYAMKLGTYSIVIAAISVVVAVISFFYSLFIE